MNTESDAGPRRESRETFENRMLRWAGTFFIFSLGVLHLLHSEEFFSATAYMGALALANFAACCGVALSLARTGSRAAWLFGAVISAGSLALFIVSRTLGLPGYEEVTGQWLNLPAWSALGMELAYLALYAAALRRAEG